MGHWGPMTDGWGVMEVSSRRLTPCCSIRTVFFGFGSGSAVCLFNSGLELRCVFELVTSGSARFFVPRRSSCVPPTTRCFFPSGAISDTGTSAGLRSCRVRASGTWLKLELLPAAAPPLLPTETSGGWEMGHWGPMTDGWCGNGGGVVGEMGHCGPMTEACPSSP